MTDAAVHFYNATLEQNNIEPMTTAKISTPELTEPFQRHAPTAKGASGSIFRGLF